MIVHCNLGSVRPKYDVIGNESRSSVNVQLVWSVSVAMEPRAVVVATGSHHVAELVRHRRRTVVVTPGDPGIYKNVLITIWKIGGSNLS